MDADLEVLRRCVGDVDRFAAHHWGCAPLLRRDAGRFGDLLDLSAVDELLTSTARRPTFRLVRNGETLPDCSVTTAVRLGGTTVSDAADVLAIGAEVAAGATLVLQGLQRTWRPVARFCRALERATSHAVQANAYLTPAGAAGLGRHHDDHDVLVIQLEGAKRWEADGLGAFALCPGDVLYLPAGTAHAAAAQEDASLHLTVGILRDTYRSVVTRALADLHDLDAPLPLGYARADGAPALRDGIAAALTTAAEHLDKADPDTLVDTEGARAQRRRKPLLEGHLASVLATIDDDCVVAARHDSPARLVEHETGADLHLVDRTVHLPADAVDAARTLVAGGPVRVGDLPGLDAAGRSVLARRLIREGLLVLLPQQQPDVH